MTQNLNGRQLMKIRMILIALFLGGIMLSPGCKSTKVKRIKVNEVRDLSGHWNDTDSRLVAEAMIADMAKRTWVEEYTAKTGRKPVIIVGTIRNKSSEHIEMVNNGRVKFVANKFERNELREERNEQQIWSREETQKRLAAETGADFMLQGSIKSIVDKEGGKSVVFYQVDLELVHLESNEKYWIGSKKIKKYIKKSRWSF